MEEVDHQMDEVDPSLVCQTCNKIVRPIEKNGDGFYTCPFCQSCMDAEIDRHLRRHGLIDEWDVGDEDQ